MRYTVPRRQSSWHCQLLSFVNHNTRKVQWGYMLGDVRVWFFGSGPGQHVLIVDASGDAKMRLHQCGSKETSCFCTVIRAGPLLQVLRSSILRDWAGVVVEDIPTLDTVIIRCENLTHVWVQIVDQSLLNAKVTLLFNECSYFLDAPLIAILYPRVENLLGLQSRFRPATD